MTEEFIQYIWQFGLFNNKGLKTVSGEKIKIIRAGILNTDSGPDFLNSRIEISGILWIGNVEIHKRASDWHRHGHNKDRAYDNVILHVAIDYDTTISRTNGEEIPGMILRIPGRHFNKYTNLINSRLWIPCEKELNKTESFVIDFCIESMLIERMEYKSERIIHQLKETNNNYDEVFQRQLFRNFGFGLNSEPFEQLARSLKYQLISRHREDLLKIEALLFGQAGFLDDNKTANRDDYFCELKNEYIFLKKKYSLVTMDVHLWKFLRLRPANFPTIRIAQLAGLLNKSQMLRFSDTIKTEKEDLPDIFNISVSGYWKEHYLFGKLSRARKKNPTPAFYENIIINTIVPFIFVWGKINNQPENTEKALNFLHECKAENNSIIRNWKRIGVNSTTAYQTQALIQLKNFYCNQKKCLNCKIGNHIIAHA